MTATTAETTKFVKISLYLNKRDDITVEKFSEYWRTNHVRLAKENAVFISKVRRYNQYHTTAEMKAEASSFGIPVLEFDGCAEVWVDSIDDWKAIVSDPDFIATIAPDEAHFIKPPITVMIGYDNTPIGEKAPA